MVTFRPLEKSDLHMLHHWIQRPHVAEWWLDPHTLEDLQKDYFSSAAQQSTTKAYIAMMDTSPIGYIQVYVALGSGDGWWENEQDPGVRGIDQFLADPDLLGHGLGTSMVRAFVDLVFSDPAVTKVQTDPDPRNARAIRCFTKAGFRPLGEVNTPDGPALLMMCERQKGMSCTPTRL